MDRYGYDTQSSNYYVIIDRKKNERIGAAYHVTTVDKIVNALNMIERNDQHMAGVVRQIGEKHDA